MQLEIFDSKPLARRTDPATSKAAAKRVGEFAGTHIDRILACLKSRGPQTADEIASKTKLLAHQVNKRLSDMQKRGLAQPTGLVGLSNSGREERLWTAL